jgi:hypothetical protein
MMHRPVIIVLVLISIVSAIDSVGEYSQVGTLTLPVEQKTREVILPLDCRYLEDTVSVYMDSIPLFKFDTRKHEVIGDIEERVLINTILYILLLMGR